MSTEKYVSEVKLVNWPQNVVFDKLSNFETFKTLFSEENINRVKEQVKDAPDFKLEDFEATKDTCSFKAGKLGRTGLQIVERDESRTIKMTGNGSIPFTFYFWIQILPQGDSQSKIRLTVHAELNMMMKMMIGKKLKKGINQLADGLTQIPYGMI